MKLTALIILIACLHVSATGYGQNQRISVSFVNSTIKEAFNEIERISEYTVFYRSEDLSVSKSVNKNFKDKSVDKILDDILSGTDLSYVLKNKVIVILPKESSELAVIQQMQTIKGRILDANGDAVPGATIVVEGTSAGAISDSNGAYEIKAPENGKVLIISFIGMETKRITIDQRTRIDVEMVASNIGVDEVVVIGYGSQRKSDLTGSVSSVKSDAIRDLPVKSLSEALQGKVAGVYVTKGSGEPGSSADIIIRGAASINGLGPLFIVDGVRMGTGNNFNLSDVENIEILKDASSAAIYGVEAAGGVILVTTKKGKSGEKMHIDFNTYYGSRNALNLPTLLDSKDYIKARKIMGVEYESWNNSPENTNWIEEMYGPAVEQKYDLSLSGGNEKSTYYISTGYLKEEGIRRANWFERYSLRMNSDHKLSNKLTVGQYLYINKTKDRPSSEGLPYRSIPLMGVYDVSRVGGWAGVPDGFQGTNWVGAAENHIYNNNNWGMEGNFFADWKIIKGLNLRATAGGYMGGEDKSQFNLLYDFGILKNGVRKLQKRLSRDETINGNMVLTYSKTFERHDIKVMMGWEAIKTNSTYVDASTEGFPVYYEPSFATSTQSSTARYADAGYGKGSQLAQFGRLNYTYSGKYLLQATVRRDGTNKFIGDYRYGIFPSVSGAWKVTEESFMKDIDWINNLKARIGWGVLGSIGSVGDFIYQSAYKSVNVHSFDGTNAVTGWGLAKFANSDIRWEKVTTKNLGLDFGFLESRLSFAVDIYDKQTTDMIYTVALPVSSGLGFYNGGGFGATINIGKISNKGVEFEANWNDKIGDLAYSVGANASFNKNKVIQIGEKGALIYEGGATWLNSSISRTEDGFAMGQFYGYIADGIYKTDTEAAAGPQQAGQIAKSGDLIYRDINSKDENGRLTGNPDGIIDDADKTYIGNPWPKCFYGINLGFEYKGFDVKAYFQGQAGVDLFNTTKGIRQSFYADWNTTSDIFNTSKFGNNNITGLPSVYQVGEGGEILRDPNGNYKNVSSFFVENGSYLKLKDLQVGYTLPENVTSKIKLGSARIYVAGSNLLTITKYTGLDPELGGGVKGRGIETDGLYPQTRFISLGLNLKF